MKWSRRMNAVVTAAALVILLAVGLSYVVHAQPQDATISGAAGTTGFTGADSSPGPSPSAAPSSILPPAKPGYAVTITAAPTPRHTPKPTHAPSGKPGRHRGDKPAPSVTPTPTPPPPPPELDFTLTTFNVLGNSHTAPDGNKRGWASGTVRAGRAVALLRRHQSDVIGFQELQGPQLSALRRKTNLDFYPGFSLGHLGTDNSIGWHRDAWVAVEKHAIRIPYFNGGTRAMPVVLLRNVRTGIEAWFANFHNPADTRRYHHQQRFRTRATRIESKLARALFRTRIPVFITGDMNERASYFCRLTSTAPVVAARGGSNAGSCQAGRPRAVDWIFGSRGVDFTDYVEDRSPLVHVTTDHPVVSAWVHLVGTSADSGALPDISGTPTGR